MTRKRTSSEITKPRRNTAGGLNEYAVNVKPGASMKQMKESAWEGAVIDKTGKKASQKRDALRHEFYESVADLLRTARGKVYRAVNTVMVEAYWNVGRMIVEEEQQGKERAEYGKRLLNELSDRLTLDFGKGYDASNLRYMRQFYLTYPICDTLCHKSVDGRSPKFKSNDPATSFPICDALRHKLTWTHFRLLLRVEKPEAHEWYMKEAAEQNWNTRVLDRQISSLYYERLKMSRDKQPVIREMHEVMYA